MLRTEAFLKRFYGSKKDEDRTLLLVNKPFEEYTEAE